MKNKGKYYISCINETVLVCLEGYLAFFQQEKMELFDSIKIKTPEKQGFHTLEAVKLVEFNLKQTLVRIMEHLCGEGVEMRWVDAYFPFTHPSWELEVKFGGEWLELVGCGVMEHDILVNGKFDRNPYSGNAPTPTPIPIPTPNPWLLSTI